MIAFLVPDETLRSQYAMCSGYRYVSGFWQVMPGVTVSFGPVGYESWLASRLIIWLESVAEPQATRRPIQLQLTRAAKRMSMVLIVRHYGAG